jgi:hypothetical protein
MILKFLKQAQNPITLLTNNFYGYVIKLLRLLTIFQRLFLGNI